VTFLSKFVWENKMTFNGKPHRVGDRGQRYEVTFLNDMNVVQVFGWTSTLGGAAAMCISIELHPTWGGPRIYDRQNRRHITKKELKQLLESKAR
jgi:hypothetical protein